MTMPTGRDLAELKRLEARLATGWERIDAARDDAERRRLEDFWLKLLVQYEQLSDKVNGTRRKG